MEPVYKRLSFLTRHPVLNLEEFHAYYLQHHGPLAAAQAGFRRYAYGYVQNHVLRPQAGCIAAFDGLTCTYQVPRADYTRGFFNTEDYRRVVRPDEERVFDLEATRSVLAVEAKDKGARQGAFKYLLLGNAGDSAIAGLLERCGALPGFSGAVFNRLRTETATGLGGGANSGFGCDALVELWLGQAGQTEQVAAAVEEMPQILHVREHVIYMQDRPPGLLPQD